MVRESELKSHKIINRPGIITTSRNPVLYYLSKRVIDVIVSIIALILLSPFMLLIAILIRLDSPGPVIYTQKRVGSARRKRNGHLCLEQTEFSFYKFRTMVDKADSSIHRAFIKALIKRDEQTIHALLNSDTQIKKLVNDPRVTRLGHILRRSSLDELPQFWNVLIGEMSLIGPRPAIPYETICISPGIFAGSKLNPG